MLLLSGSRDEVVPSEHMQGLWELVRNRVPRAQLISSSSTPEEGKDESVEGPSGGHSRIISFANGTHSMSSSFVWRETSMLMVHPAQTTLVSSRVTGRPSLSLLGRSSRCHLSRPRRSERECDDHGDSLALVDGTD